MGLVEPRAEINQFGRVGHWVFARAKGSDFKNLSVSAYLLNEGDADNWDQDRTRGITRRGKSVEQFDDE